MSKGWMPLYVGDYLADTSHLTQGEHGAYMLFIMHYWQHGSLPNDREQCYRIAHALDEQSKSNADAVLSHFFKISKTDSCHYRHTRIDRELQKAIESHERRKSAAFARWKPMQSKSNGDALHIQSQSQSHINTKPMLANQNQEPKLVCEDCSGNGTTIDGELCHCERGKDAAIAREVMAKVKAKTRKTAI